MAESYVHPTKEQLAAFGELDLDEPVVMLNLVRFEETAKEGYGADGLTGEQAYQRYGANFAAMQRKYGAEVVYVGRAEPGVIGPPDESWDLVLLVRYPTARAFAEMAVDPEYLPLTKDRTAAVADSRLVPTREGFTFGT